MFSQLMLMEAVRTAYPQEDFFIDQAGKVNLQNGTILSQDDIATLLAQHKITKAWALVRSQRDLLLQQSDWRIVNAMEKSKRIDVNVLSYRQALRDFPNQLLQQGTIPEVDQNGFLVLQATWPTLPATSA